MKVQHHSSICRLQLSEQQGKGKPHQQQYKCCPCVHAAPTYSSWRTRPELPYRRQGGIGRRSCLGRGLSKGSVQAIDFPKHFLGLAEYHAHFPGGGQRSKDFGKRGCELHGCVELFINVYLPCGVLLANVCLGRACIGRGPFPKCISKHEEDPNRDQTVLRFMSFPALRSDHRTASCESNPARFLSVCPRAAVTKLFSNTHSPFSHCLTFFFCDFLSSTFTSSIISGHRATAVSTSEGIYYAAARG